MAFYPVPGKPGLIKDDLGVFYKAEDVVDTPYYSSVLFASGSQTAGTTKDWFKSKSTQGKMESNFDENGKVGAAIEFRLKRLGLEVPEYIGDTRVPIADAQKVIHNTYIEIKKSQEFIIAQGPSILFPSGLGFLGSTTENNTTIASLGFPASGGIKPLEKEELITEKTQLEGTIEFPDRSNTLSSFTAPSLSGQVLVKLFLFGVKSKPGTSG